MRAPIARLNMDLKIPAGLDAKLAATFQDPFFAGYLDAPIPGDRSNIDSLLELAQQFAVTPISGFNVGALAIGKSGKCYIGANMEFPGVPLHASLHAEQSAVLNAWTNGEQAIETLIISESPCGHCRQFLFELYGADELIIVAKGASYHLADLMPEPFAQVRTKGKGLLDSSTRPLVKAHSGNRESDQRAINAASRSYAPYSHSPEGFIIETINGNRFAGRTAESIAFNPSVPPAVGALNQMNLSAHRDEAITRCTHARLATAVTHSYAFSTILMRSICSVPVESVLMETDV